MVAASVHSAACFTSMVAQCTGKAFFYAPFMIYCVSPSSAQHRPLSHHCVALTKSQSSVGVHSCGVPDHDEVRGSGPCHRHAGDVLPPRLYTGLLPWPGREGGVRWLVLSLHRALGTSPRNSTPLSQRQDWTQNKYKYWLEWAVRRHLLAAVNALESITEDMNHGG